MTSGTAVLQCRSEQNELPTAILVNRAVLVALAVLGVTNVLYLGLRQLLNGAEFAEVAVINAAIRAGILPIEIITTCHSFFSL